MLSVETQRLSCSLTYSNSDEAKAALSSSRKNLQTFAGARTLYLGRRPTQTADPIHSYESVGGISAPAVTTGGRNFVVEDNSDFVNLTTALGRSCDVQVRSIRRAVTVFPIFVQ